MKKAYRASTSKMPLPCGLSMKYFLELHNSTFCKEIENGRSYSDFDFEIVVDYYEADGSLYDANDKLIGSKSDFDENFKKKIILKDTIGRVDSIEVEWEKPDFIHFKSTSLVKKIGITVSAFHKEEDFII